MSALAPVAEEQPLLTDVIRFLDSLSFDALPSDVLLQAKRVVLDTVGCIIGGLDSQPAQPILRTFSALGGAGDSNILGTSTRLSVTDAAYVNSYLADVLDFEDTLVSHPSAAVVPAALAIGQRCNSSGQDLLVAVVAGYEVGTRIAQALVPSASAGREVASEFYWKSIPAAVTSGLLLGLRGKEWVNALGYAASAAPAPRRGGFERRPLSWLKTNFAGQTQVGVLAALLAAGGFQVYRGMLDGSRTISGVLGSDRWEPDGLTADLGAEWLIRRTGFKVYPCCLYLHPVLEALEGVKRQRAIEPSAVERIRVGVPAVLASEFNDPSPATAIDAEFSVPYVVAVSALAVPPGPEWLRESRLRDPRTLDMAAGVEVVSEPVFTESFRSERRVRASVSITFTDGAVVRSDAADFHGSADDPMTNEELADKYLRLTADHLGQPAAQRTLQVLWNLDQIAAVNELVHHLDADQRKGRR